MYDLELVPAELMKAQKESQPLRDAHLIIDETRIQIFKSKVEISRLVKAPREATKKEETGSKKRLIYYNGALSGIGTKLASSDEVFLWRQCK